MKKLHFFLFIIISLGLLSCEKDNDSNNTLNTQGEKFTNGVFVVNEGNFNWGNASLSFIDTETETIENKLFKTINNKDLGDVALSMTIIDTMALISVNNSGKIEIISTNTGKSVKTITGFTSPRFIQPVSDSKAFVSDLYGSELKIIDLKTLLITGSVPAFKSTEAMLVYKNKLFVANWSFGKAIQVFDTDTNEKLTEIEVTLEPNSMVLDNSNRIWVLSGGGYLNEASPTLSRINPDTYALEQTFVFSDKNSSPMKLCIDHTGENLYYLNTDIYKFNINDSALPSYPIVAAEGRNFYGMNIDHQENIIYVSDAKDYVDNGEVLLYSTDGTLKYTYNAGVVPGYFVFLY